MEINAYSPQGHLIIGTSDTVLCTARGEFETAEVVGEFDASEGNVQGKLLKMEFTNNGTTDVSWDCQETRTSFEGQPLYADGYGNDTPANEVVFKAKCPHCSEEFQVEQDVTEEDMVLIIPVRCPLCGESIEDEV